MTHRHLRTALAVVSLGALLLLAYWTFALSDSRMDMVRAGDRLLLLGYDAKITITWGDRSAFAGISAKGTGMFGHASVPWDPRIPMHWQAFAYHSEIAMDGRRSWSFVLPAWVPMTLLLIGPALWLIAPGLPRAKRPRASNVSAATTQTSLRSV